MNLGRARWLWLAACLLGGLSLRAPLSAQTLPSAQGWCELGGQSVTLAGLPATPKVQGSYPSCTVTVYLTGTTQKVPLWSDPSGDTTLSNPFTASTMGLWLFYGRSGLVDIVLSGGGLPSPVTLTSVQLFSPSSVPTSFAGAMFESAHNFIPQTLTQALVSGTPATVTPSWPIIPPGVIAGDHLRISTSPSEIIALSNVGTACPGGTVRSMCFTPSNSRSGSWALASATSGIQEAVNDAGAGGWVILDTLASPVYTPILLTQTIRITGFANFDASTGTRILQQAADTDTIQIGSSSIAPSDIVLEHFMVEGVSGTGTDTGVAIHCVSCVRLKLMDITAKSAHAGLFLDSAQGHAFDASILDSHFISNYYGVELQGGSANRDTFVGSTVDSNVYGVFDDGGWVHTWIGNDIESNIDYGYWQEVSDPAAYSGHNVVLHGNYFENNGSTSGQGDVFLGQLVGGGTGNNGAGCLNCEVTDNIFNAANSSVTALSLGAVNATVSDNTYSGYGTGKIYAYVTGPNPNFTHVLSLGDGAGDKGSSAASGAYGGARAGTITRIDSNGGLTLGGWDQLNDSQGSPIRDTTIESPTGNVSVRGKPGGETASNPASLFLDGNSSGEEGSSIEWRNASTALWQINADPFGNGSHDFCLMNDLTNPTAARCIAYINPQSKWLFSYNGPSGSLPTRTQDYQFAQVTNGDSALVINRATDTSPTGSLLDLEDATLSHPLFRVDANGVVTTGNWDNSNSSFTIGPLLATTGHFSSEVSASNYGAVSATTGEFSGAVTNHSTVTTTGVTNANGGIKINGASVQAILGGTTGTESSGTYAAGACIGGGLNFGSGVALGMVATANPSATPPTGLMWNALVDSADHVTINVCNVTPSSITWSAGAVWYVRVIP